MIRWVRFTIRCMGVLRLRCTFPGRGAAGSRNPGAHANPVRVRTTPRTHCTAAFGENPQPIVPAGNAPLELRNVRFRTGTCQNCGSSYDTYHTGDQ
jgi:hypothetical protein